MVRKEWHLDGKVISGIAWGWKEENRGNYDQFFPSHIGFGHESDILYI